jgi:peptide/nickel transport system permease protein
VAAYLVRRIGVGIGLLFLLSITVFFLFSILPSDPARLTCGKICTPELLQSNRERLGLDKPVVDQYETFVTGIFTGRVFDADSPDPIVCGVPCLGYSFTRHEEVTSLIGRALPITIWLALGAFVIWMVVGILLGIYAALRRGRWQDRTVLGVSMIGYSLPSFFFGLVVIFIVVIKFHILPFPQWVSPLEDPVRFFQTMILPWMVLAILNAAFYMRLTRNQMLEALGEDFIRTARAKGLEERTVVRHALRAGLTPIVTIAGLDLAILLGGAIITESIFSLPGIGSLTVSSVNDSDLPLITGITLIAATFIIVANLFVDLLYAVIDPRVRI